MLDFERRRESGRGSAAGAGAGALGGGGTPPNSPFARPTTAGEGGDKKKYLVYVALAAATGVALYLGLAVGSSLQSGGGGGSSNADLPTRTPGQAELACPGPVNVNQGQRVTLKFASIGDGYRIDKDPGVRPVSPAATVSQVSAVAQEGNTVLFTAATVPNSAGRTDEFQLTATFSNGGDKKQEQCTVRVAGPAGSPTPAAVSPTVPAGSPTSTAVPPTATRVPVVQPTAVPTAVPTQAPPTATPDPSTPTPSVPTPVPTAGGTLISPTQVPTAVPTPGPSPTPLP
jgi:hypothetical protein